MRFSLKLMSFCVLFSSCRFVSWDIAFCKGPYMSLKDSVSGYSEVCRIELWRVAASNRPRSFQPVLSI
jgi:hypothetical protein